jgi:cytochrome b-561 domain containing protein 2
LFSKESSLLGSFSHRTSVNLHWILNSLGLFSILIAYAAIYKNKEEHERPHLTTWHGIIGIVTIVYTVIQFIAGHNLTLFNGFIRRFVPYNSLAIYHATSGTFLFVLACTSLSLGVNSNWFANQSGFVWYLTFALTAVFGLIVTNQVTAKYVKPKLNNSNVNVKVNNKKKKLN